MVEGWTGDEAIDISMWKLARLGETSRTGMNWETQSEMCKEAEWEGWQSKKRVETNNWTKGVKWSHRQQIREQGKGGKYSYYKRELIEEAALD